MAVKRSDEFGLVALYLSKFGRRRDEGDYPLPPRELHTDRWSVAYSMFYDALGESRTLRTFHNSLKATRDQFDSHLDSGRRGWHLRGAPKPLPELDASVLARWGSRSQEMVWDAVFPLADPAVAEVPLSVIRDLVAEQGTDDEAVIVGREGRMKARISTHRERSPRLRAAAFHLHGHCCNVCGFDFEKSYGPWGRDFAEVHHLDMLGAASKHGREVNVATDLAVVCANCHRMLHRKAKTVLTLDELRAMLRDAKQTEN